MAKPKYVKFTYSTNDWYVKYGEDGDVKRVTLKSLTKHEIEAAFKMTGHWHRV